MSFHIVLYQPEIPYNTGNIARTCAATNTELHIIRPMSFSTDDRMLKRAGLDYWHAVQVHYYDSLEQLMELYAGQRFFFVETKSEQKYTDISYQAGDFFVFGRETSGLPSHYLRKHAQTCIRIPQNTDHVRSLNVSNTVAIVLYEALRQVQFWRLN